MAKRQKLNLIEELTTHKNDFQVWPLDPPRLKSEVRTRTEPPRKSPPPCIRLDPQSHAIYKPSVYVPFDLYFERKPIVQTDPRECFSLAKKTESFGSSSPDQPTTVLSPSVPISSITDEYDFQTIMKYTYSGTKKSLTDEAALKISKKPKPPNRVDPKCNTLNYKAQLYPPLPPGWVPAACHWDCLQSRKLGDPTRSFWARRGPEIECSCCCNPLPKMIPSETKEKINKLIAEDNLRLPYNITVTGYSGYRQMCAKGVPLEKKHAT